MDDELNLELDGVESNVENKLKVKNRFEKLSEKVITTSKEKDEAIAKANVAEEARSKAEKDLNFYKGFSANVSKYPQASAYQDKIKERVDKGYDAEEAILAVLAKEGKLTIPQAPAPTPEQVEGGSAGTRTEGGKSIKDMTSAEKLAALQDADNAGMLANALRGR